MSYHIYHTKAYIIDSKESGEANKILTVLTEDLGLIRVSAQSVRLGVSKLKASIQDFSYSKVSVVRGKEVWRLTNAEKMISLFDKRVALSVRKLLIEYLQFIKRLTPEDVSVKEVFTLMNTFSAYCFEQKGLTQSEITALRILFQLRVLELLGYGIQDKTALSLSGRQDIQKEDISLVEEHAAIFTAEIESAIQQSHL